MSTPRRDGCEQSELTCAYAAQALAESEVAAAEAHIASWSDCQRELQSLHAVVNHFVAWPTDVLRPTTPLQDRLALRIAEETGKQPVPPPPRQWSEPEWEQVAPGASYPAHTHAGIEELHLLDGELWIDEHKLVPGDYNYGAPGAGDDRVWSRTGCTCLLVTSTRDALC